MPNWRWIRFDQSQSCSASSSDAPITVAITWLGYGLQRAATASQRRSVSTRAHSSSRKPRIAGRHFSTARGVKAGLTSPRSRPWSLPLMWRMLRRISS